jgi:hypothetical protein
MERRTKMNDTKTMGLRLPVQAAVERSATGATLADGTGVEASDWFDVLNTIGKVVGTVAPIVASL